MPTIVDALAIELSLDPRQLEKGLSSVVEKVRTTRDDYERHAKAFQAVADGLLRVLTPLASAIIGITSAIEAINWSQHASAAAAEFSNLADIIGMNIAVLSAWTQAAEAAGEGGGKAVRESFSHQQETMRTMLPGGTGLTDTPFLQGLQHYFGPGGGDVTRYLDKDGNIDLDRFNKDIVSASDRLHENLAQRQQWMGRLHITDPAQLSLYQSRSHLDEQLRIQREEVGVLTQENVNAMKKLHADWANLETSAENLRIEIMTKLVDPLHEGLTSLQQILTALKNWMSDPNNKTWLNPEWWMQGGGVNRQPPSWYPDWMLTPEERVQRHGGGSTSTPVAPAPASPAPAPASPAPAPSSRGGGVFMPVPSPSSVSSVPFTSRFPGFPGFPGAFGDPASHSTSSTGLPQSLITGVPEQSGYQSPILSHHSSIDPGMLNLPHTAAMFNQSLFSAGSRSSINSNSNITIGAMSFHATTQDAALGHAPAGSERTLGIGAYAVDANSSLV